MKKRSELIFRLILVPIDYAMMIAGFAAAYLVRIEGGKPLAFPTGGRAFVGVMLLVLPWWILVFALTGLYSLDSRHGRLYELGRIFAASAAGTMLLIFLDFFNPEPLFPSKSIPILGFVFAFLLVAIARAIVRLVQHRLFQRGVGVRRLLILGQGDTYQQLISAYHNAYHGGIEVVNLRDKFVMPQDIDSLRKIHNRYQIDEIITTTQHLTKQKPLEVIQFCQDNHIRYRFVPDIVEAYGSNVQPSLFFGVPVLELQSTPLEDWGRIVKRIIDFITSFFALIILSPIFLIIALLIKIFDRGPVFFAHTRLSRGGKKTKFYKFRSMKWRYTDGGPNGGKSPMELIADFGDPALVEEWKRDQKLKQDPRVSSIGRFLRRTSLDELPQLYNILRGDLSLVGPRPIVPEELTRYGQRAGLFLAIRPGLTGLWQVSGRNDISYDERVKLDIYYVENWNLLLDLSIILRTIGMILRGRGGY